MNSFLRPLYFVFALSMISMLASTFGQTPTSQPQVKVVFPLTASDSDNKKTLVATVFGEPLYMEQITPAEMEIKSKELPQQEFNQWLRGYQVARIYETLWLPVSRRYIDQEKLAVSEDELEAITAAVERQLKSNPNPTLGNTLTPQEIKGIHIAWARASLIDWKLCKSLYQKHGGRVGVGASERGLHWMGSMRYCESITTPATSSSIDPTLNLPFGLYAQRDNFADAYPKGERLQQLFATPSLFAGESESPAPSLQGLDCFTH